MNLKSPQTRLNMRRAPWLCLTWSCIGMGGVGVLLPLVPTTPFLLVAAWAAPKGSPRLAQWLDSHPRLAPYLEAWRTQRAIPIRAKALAVAMLAMSWLLLYLMGTAPLVLIAMAALFTGLATYLVTRPNSETNR